MLRWEYGVECTAMAEDSSFCECSQGVIAKLTMLLKVGEEAIEADRSLVRSLVVVRGE